MGAKERGETAFSRLLTDSAASIADTLTLFSEAAPAGSKKVEWKEVITAAEGVAKHATTTGVLWTGKVTKKEGIENINCYIQALQGFLLRSYGSTAGAGPTLLSCIDLASKQVASSSLGLLRGAVAGVSNNTQDVDLPVLVGYVWEACDGVKKAPLTNRVAIGRSLTQVAISVKDVLRELGDFKQDTALPCTSSAGAETTAEGGGGGSSDESTELSNELSMEEMQVVQSVKGFVASMLDTLKQLLHIVAGTSRASKDAQKPDLDATPVLEKLLKISKDLGVGVDELGASLYPPQEMETLQETVVEVEGLMGCIQAEVYTLIGAIPEDFVLALSTWKDAAVSLNRVLEMSNGTT